MFQYVAGTFAMVVAIIGAADYLLVLKPEQDQQSSLRKRMKTGSVAKAASQGGLLKEETPFSSIPLFDTVLKGLEAVTGPMQRLIDRSGRSLTVAALCLMCLCAGIATFLVVQSLAHFVFVAAAAGLLAMWLPIWVLGFIAGRRVLKFEEQFPEAIDLLSRALRAGHAFTTGLSMVAEELPDPVGTEFRLAYDRQNFGMPMPAALRSLGERVPLLDAKFFVTAVLTQRDAGGNLSEVLDNLSSVVRERFKVKRQVRVVTAHARMTGWVLALLPPALGVALTLLSPENMSLLWTDPTGIKMLIAALTLQVIGTLIIRKLVDIEYDMADPLILAIGLVFVSVAMLSALVASTVLGRQSPERRRLREMTAAATGIGSSVAGGTLALGPTQDAVAKRVASIVPKSPKEMGRLQRRMARAGYPSARAAVFYAAAEVVLPIVLALVTVAYMGISRGGFLALFMAGIGYTLPGLWLSRKTAQRQKQIQNGLPDALDLLIVCVEAGAGLDAAIVKAAEELRLAYPYLADELKLITVETRAGKPRIEAFRNFAQRTGVDDVRALVAMLVQTDRFGTSIAQALRIHAATARTKRRQRAEERAAKLGVKLVFPLVFCLFPALYVVVLGPAVIKIMHHFLGG